MDVVTQNTTQNNVPPLDKVISDDLGKILFWGAVISITGFAIYKIFISKKK